MRLSSKLIVVSVFCICVIENLKSQIKIKAKEESTEIKKTSYFKLEAGYLSNAVYLGRKDSSALPYITPALSYYHKSGLYASAYLGYLNSKEDKRVDYYSFDLGYEFNITKNLVANIYGDKTFNNSSSSRVNSDINGSLSGSLSYDFNFVELSSELNAYFSTKTDFVSSTSINHAFYIGKEDKQWTINPTALINFSTLYFYEGATNKNVARKQLANPFIVSVTATTSVINNKLTLMNYEFSLPISFETKKWGVYFTPTYSVAQNPIATKTVIVMTRKNGTKTTNTVNSTPYSERHLENTFYGEVGIYIKI